MSARVWVVPLRPTPALLRVTVGVLDSHAVTHATVAVDELRARLRDRRPVAALVHGGVITPLLMDAQRWLAECYVPTVILVEGLTDEAEAVLLDRGAHDVLAIPTSRRRLGSRMEAMVRATGSPSQQDRVPSRLTAGGDLVILPRQRTVHVGRHPVAVTRSEFEILLTLALRRGEVVTREELTQALDGRENLSPRALESHVSRLRTKLRGAGASELLLPVRGVGYRLAD